MPSKTSAFQLTHPLPFLLQKGQDPQKNSVLAWWHLLSLDAPTVAATWTWWISWCAGVRIPLADPAAMFFAVWILYVTDRLLDARPLSQALPSVGLEQRHHFHHAHRSAFIRGALLTLVPLAWLVHRMHEGELRLYVLLGCLLGGWLLLVHARPASEASQAHRLPKELAVGIFFPAAVFLPTVARAPALHLALLPPVLGFGCVCTLNCLFLFVWEHTRARHAGHPTTQWGSRNLLPLCVAALLFCALQPLGSVAFPGVIRLAHPWALGISLSLSCTVFLLLHQIRFGLDRTTLRACADLALLTPWLVILLWHMGHLHG